MRRVLVVLCVALSAALLPGARLTAQSRPVVLTPAAIAQRATAATVTIVAIGANGDTLGQGSGFLVRATGEIVTNVHVMQGASRAIVRLASGEQYDRVQAIDADSLADIAIIKVPGFGLPTVTLSGHMPPVGSKVVVIGSPLGLAQTVSDGLVSAYRMRDGKQLLQISAPISHGSSGGPVFNEAGEVIGIANSSREDGQQLNFAVPAKYALGMLAEHHESRPLAALFGGSGGATSASGGLRAGAPAPDASAEALAAHRAFLARPNPPAIARPILPFFGAFLIVDTTWIQPPHDLPYEVRNMGVVYLLENGVGLRATHRAIVTGTPQGDTLGDVQTELYLRDLVATADGRLSLGGLPLGSAPSILGYQSGDGAFFRGHHLMNDTLPVASRIHLERYKQPLNENGGLYHVTARTRYTSGTYEAPELLDWGGSLIVSAVANGDSVYVRLFLRNSAGGSTGFARVIGRPPGDISAVSIEGDMFVTVELRNGRVSGTIKDVRAPRGTSPGATYTGTFTGTHP